MKKKFEVSFSGFLTVEAKSAQEAKDIANKAFEQISYGNIDPLLFEINMLQADDASEE